MKNFCFIVASSDDRIHLLNRCVECAKNSKYSGCDFYLYFQGNGSGIEDISFFKEIIWDDHLRGVFTPRYELMKHFGIEYDYTILIDDDLFMQPETSFENAMRWCDFEQNAGAVTLVHGKAFVKNEIRCVSATGQFFNVCGGIVFPKRSIQIIIDYFKNKEKDYTEDVVWLLLYIKGYELYKDFTSYSIHKTNRKGVNGELTGFNKMRVEKPHIPILSEWFDSKKIYQKSTKCVVYKVKEMLDINEAGKMERNKNKINLQKTLEGTDGKTEN